MKYAAFTGTMHAAARVTPFFESHSEAATYAEECEISFSFIKQVSNWKEHQQWNSDKVGFYAEHQVTE